MYNNKELLDILGAYLTQINRHGDKYPGPVISDIKASITYVLKVNNYNGKYKTQLTKGE